MKKILYFGFLFLGLTNVNAQDLISGGNNTWIFHTPDDGRTTMHITSKLNGSWQWAKETVFYNNGNIKFNGSVGIGTADTKGFKLGVNGKIAAEEVKVALYGNWSDFVFKKEYNLPTLTEVENHIKEKGHLKDIPSAKEVEKNGFYLGEMDAKLLQKIEELTLYTIAQEKKIEKVEKENESLKFLATKFLELQKRLEKLEKE